MNYDFLQRFPNQNLEYRPDMCVGEGIADIGGNIVKQPMDAGFSYAAALKVSNSLPTTAGSDPYSGMIGALVYGLLPTDKVPFDVNVSNELYEANLVNYALDMQNALAFAQKGVRSLHSYTDISNYLMNYKQGVQVNLKWFESYNAPNSDGTLPAPAGGFTNHSTACYEDTIVGLRIKPWLGPSFGDHGYVYLNQLNFGKSFVTANAFDPNAWRWLQLAYAASTRPWLIPDILPQLKS